MACLNQMLPKRLITKSPFQIHQIIIYLVFFVCGFSLSSLFLGSNGSEAEVVWIRTKDLDKSNVAVVPTARKTKVLFLMSKDTFEATMDRWFEQIVAAARTVEDIEVVDLWGSSWPGWDKNLKVWENIQNRFGFVDVVHVHEWHDPPEIRGKVSSVSSGFYHELHCREVVGKCIEPDVFKPLDTIFFSYANLAIYNTAYTATKLYMHQPHGAPVDVFYHPVDSPRDIDVLLIGKVSGLYPLRSKLYDWIEKGQLQATIRKHPGYFKPEFKDIEAYHNQSLSSQFVDYVAQIKRAKIVLLCSSSRKFALRKYIEAAMAGSLIIGDIPAERSAEFRDYVVEINVDDSLEKVREVIDKWLKDEPARLKRASIGQKINMENYNYKRFVENLHEGWNRFRAGDRGMYLKHPFTIPEIIR